MPSNAVSEAYGQGMPISRLAAAIAKVHHHGVPLAELKTTKAL